MGSTVPNKKRPTKGSKEVKKKIRRKTENSIIAIEGPCPFLLKSKKGLHTFRGSWTIGGPTTHFCLVYCGTQKASFYLEICEGKKSPQKGFNEKELEAGTFQWCELYQKGMTQEGGRRVRRNKGRLRAAEIEAAGAVL